eukprot:TRINITY_DN10736_c0_g1_i1.p1 TRINITY_DN10736_c0_g1~~TRINITY_DN10736_c0_g1_i1.p1  ORF type:complete len:241 (-),score=77.55 TRINITY_DN10736_c0_g1_i1:179-901(-)
MPNAKRGGSIFKQAAFVALLAVVAGAAYLRWHGTLGHQVLQAAVAVRAWQMHLLPTAADLAMSTDFPGTSYRYRSLVWWNRLAATLRDTDLDGVRAAGSAFTMVWPLVPSAMESIAINDHIPAIWVTPTNHDPRDRRVILYLHSGGLTSGSAYNEAGCAYLLAQSTGIRCLSVDYRLAPEHNLLSLIDDIVEAYEYLLAHGYPANKIAFQGTSGGAAASMLAIGAIKLRMIQLPAAAGCP